MQIDLNHRRYRFKPKMSYERLGTEGDFDEDKEFEKYRRTKLAGMSKGDKHKLIYSNQNLFDLVDVNQDRDAKAWTVLFHFKGKDKTSSLYEHFHGINKRNQSTKIKQSKVHQQVQRHLMD